MFFGKVKRPLRRISVRLTLWHSFLFMAAVLAVLGSTYVLLRSGVEAQERDAVLFRMYQYSGEYRNAGLAAVQTMASLRKGRAQKGFFIRIAGPNNETVYIRDEEDWAQFRPKRLSKMALPTGPDRVWHSLEGDHGELLVVSELMPDGNTLQVGKSTEESTALIEGFQNATLGVLGIFVPLSFLGGALIASRTLRPLQKLTEAVQAIVATSKFSARVPPTRSGDELDELVRLFNAMLNQIEALIRGMRESLDNVAHDLRTPMTRLKHKAQHAIEHTPDAASLREALADCVEESEVVVNMLNTLMDIAEAEAGLTRIVPRQVEVTSWVDAARDLYGDVAEEKGVKLETDVPAGLIVRGDPALLRRVLANLLDNAIKYTPAGGQVRVRAAQDNGAVAVSVQDSGSGILPEDLPKIWERLFRGDKSRSERGLGLGLSFVRALVHAHGGSVEARSDVGSGTEIVVRLPAGEES